MTVVVVVVVVTVGRSDWSADKAAAVTVVTIVSIQVLQSVGRSNITRSASISSVDTRFITS